MMIRFPYAPFGYYTPAPLTIALYTSLSIVVENTDFKYSPCTVYYVLKFLVPRLVAWNSIDIAACQFWRHCLTNMAGTVH